MFGSNAPTPEKSLPELRNFSPEFVEGITDNASLTKAWGHFAASFTSQDPDVQHIKTVFLAVQTAFPELANPSWRIPISLNACRQTLLQHPIHTFAHIKVTNENEEDLARYAEILGILEYVLTHQIQNNTNSFLCWFARKTVDSLLATQRLANQAQGRPKVGTLEEELKEIEGKFSRWRETLKTNLSHHQQRKLLKSAEETLLEEISRLNTLSDEEALYELFVRINNHRNKIANISDSATELKQIEQNTFLVTVIEALFTKYTSMTFTTDSPLENFLQELMKSVNDSNKTLQDTMDRIRGNTDDDGLCDADEQFFQAYISYFRFFLTKKQMLSNKLELTLPESTNQSPVTQAESSSTSSHPEAPVSLAPPLDSAPQAHENKLNRLHEEMQDYVLKRERERVLREAKMNLKPLPPKPVAPNVMGENVNEIINRAIVERNITEHPVNPVTAAGTARPFLNARRTSEVMTSSLCLLYAGGVGLETLGKISLASSIEPFFVAASFASPVAIAALAACALVLVIGMAEMAYTYHENTQVTRPTPT
jgi:hypothetical protein